MAKQTRLPLRIKKRGFLKRVRKIKVQLFKKKGRRS